MVESSRPADSGPATLAAGEEGFFCQQDEDLKQAERDAVEEVNMVQGFDGHRSAVVPWLQRTGIAEHIQRLRKAEIRASIALPKTTTRSRSRSPYCRQWRPSYERRTAGSVTGQTAG